MSPGARRSTDKSPPPAMAGHTMLELMVVMAIIVILATQVIFTYTDPMAKVKAAAFNLRADMNMARSEAVNRHRKILVEFVPGAAIDGYRICVDDNIDDACIAADNDTILKEVSFRKEVRFVDRNATNGPTKTPGGDLLDFEDGTANDDGIAFSTKNYVKMLPNGSSSSGGSVYIYAPEPNDHSEMRATPIALVVTPHTGRVRLMRWRIEEKKWRNK